MKNRMQSRLCGRTPGGWLGHSAAVPQISTYWGFAALSRQPPGHLRCFPPRRNKQRTLELLADEALFGLAVDERLELDALLAGTPGVNGGCMQTAAAVVHLASIAAELGPMPMSLKESILAQARK